VIGKAGYRGEGRRTGGKALLQLLGLVRVLQDKGVQVPLAADLELDLLGVGVLLDPGGCNNRALVLVLVSVSDSLFGGYIAISSKRTGSILPPADLDELWLIVSNLVRANNPEMLQWDRTFLISAIS
jgi:hypothetical protein